MNVISRISKGLDKLCIFMLVFITLVMTFSLVIMIFGRNFFNMSFASLEEISRFTLVWLTFFGSAIAYKRKEHMGMDFVVGKLRGKTATYVSYLQEIIAIILFSLFVYYGVELVVFNLDNLSVQSKISMGYVYIVIPIVGFIIVVHAIDHILKSIKRTDDMEEVHIESSS